MMSEDLIRRSDAIKAIEAEECLGYVECQSEWLFDRIRKIPTIEPKHGEWVSQNPYWHTAICSNCNKVTMFEEWDEEVIEYDFCPNCGADMREREGE